MRVPQVSRIAVLLFSIRALLPRCKTEKMIVATPDDHTDIKGQDSREEL